MAEKYSSAIKHPADLWAQVLLICQRDSFYNQSSTHIFTSWIAILIVLRVMDCLNFTWPHFSFKMKRSRT
jgi:hypothetical protein